MGNQLTSRTVLRLIGRQFTPRANHNPTTDHVVLTISAHNENPLLMVICERAQARFLLSAWQSEMDRLDGITRTETEAS